MNRRTFILGSIASGAVAGGGAVWLGMAQNQEPLLIDYSLSKLNRLMEQNPIATGEWNLYQIFTHCAQSVEYSISGFPEQKPDLFINTAGKTAFSLFSSRREMIHALDEPIPGAPKISDDGHVTYALERFRRSLVDFREYNATLAPHFAYGQLTKAQYEMAHVMHFNNHLHEIELMNVSS